MCVTLERNCNHGSAYQELPQLFVGPDPALSLVTDMHHWAHLQLAQPSVHLHAPDQTSVTGFHLCMCHGNSLQPWEWRLTARTPTAVVPWQLTTVLASGHGPYYYICLQLALVITQVLQLALLPNVCTPPLRPHHCLPWS